jgi:malonyl-CoA O-methyltransferase
MSDDAMPDDPWTTPIVRAFDAAADSYDAASQVQREIARDLVARAAREVGTPPKKILDLGSGAGHVTGAALELWPRAEIVALDAAPAMLETLRAKYPGVQTVLHDAARPDGLGRFDLILSSMMLHWLPDPRAALAHWRNRLAPGGQMHVAVPVEGSLAEWHEFLRRAGLEDGLWTFPPADLGRDFFARAEQKPFPVNYPDARAFLQNLKRTGAHKSRPGHSPLPLAALRRLLAASPGPFVASFQILFLAIDASEAE